MGVPEVLVHQVVVRQAVVLRGCKPVSQRTSNDSSKSYSSFRIGNVLAFSCYCWNFVQKELRAKSVQIRGSSKLDSASMVQMWGKTQQCRYPEICGEIS